MTNSAIAPETLYVELDSLLDTRLGTIARLSQDLATQVLLSGYHTRECDIFAGVDKEAYRTLYKQRDVETLKYSTVTAITPFLKHLVGVLTEQAIARPYQTGPKIVVNLYPYEFAEEETETLHQCVVHWMNDLAPVELVFISPTMLTPLHCKQTYSMMFVYEYEEWLNIHSKAFEQHQLPEVELYVPALFKQLLTAEELAQITKEATHPFRAAEIMASPLVGLKLIDVQHFSVLRLPHMPVAGTHASAATVPPPAPARPD